MKRFYTLDMSRKTMSYIEKMYLEHRRASARCDAWAAKAIRYRRAGEWRKAERAEDWTFRWLTRMKRLADAWRGLRAPGTAATLH
jgi:hypothetical protein